MSYSPEPDSHITIRQDSESSIRLVKLFRRK